MLKFLSLKQKTRRILIIAGLLISGMNVLAQNSNARIEGKPVVQVFSHYRSNLGGSKEQGHIDELALSRAALGYKAKLSPHFSIAAVMDVTNESGIYKPFLKLGSLTYKNKKWKVDVGLIKTKQYKVVQEGFWSYRYVYKSFQDTYRYNSSVDMGVSVEYQALDYLSVDAILQNGGGAKNIQPNLPLRMGGGVTLDPYKPLIIRLYYDYASQSDIVRQSFSAFVGYKYKKKFRVGLEYNYQKNHRLVEKHDLFGYSIYGRYNVDSKLSVFARYDSHNSNVIDESVSDLAWNVDNDGRIAIIGVSYDVLKNVSASLNYRREMYQVKDEEDLNWIFLNFHYKL